MNNLSIKYDIYSYRLFQIKFITNSNTFSNASRFAKFNEKLRLNTFKNIP